ncbi:MAG: DUF1761 domain-containing protein [Bacteroidia bacterium]|nr:DUF1761 domain-containing protein [Bacteroidia bacterium]
MDFNFSIVFAATAVPLIIGFIWYHPKVFGTAWMKVTGMTPEQGKKSNMWVTFGLTILFSFFMATVLMSLVVHQIHVGALLTNQPDSKDANSESMAMLKRFMELYGNSYRTFKHGVFHGTLTGIFLALPIIAINALFEQRGFKYIAINAGYFIVSMALMGGLICAFL